MNTKQEKVLRSLKQENNEIGMNFVNNLNELEFLYDKVTFSLIKQYQRKLRLIKQLT